MNRKQLLKTISGVVLLLCCTALFLLPLLWVVHTEHCTDAECGVCHHLAATVKVLSGLMAAGFVAFRLPAALARPGFVLAEAARCISPSPVALKVRLND